MIEKAKPPFPGISIVVITYNEERNISSCLQCLRVQDYPEDKYEIIVVDASTDATATIASGMPGVRVIKSRKGFSRQKNTGWRAARFDIVAFTDADCLVPADWLAIIAEAMSNPQVVAVGGNALAPPGCGWFALCVACVGHPGGGAIGFDANVVPGPRGIAFIAGCNGAFRKSVLEEVGGFGVEFQDGGEDVDLSRRLRQAGYRLDYLPELNLYHKPHTPFWHYVRWNVGVGVTKYSLNRPTLARILLDPRFPAWPLLAMFGWLDFFLAAGTTALLCLPAGWMLYLVFLAAFSRPFQLLIKRRRKIGLDPISVLTMVPFLVLVRQLAIPVGQLKKWMQTRRTIAC